MGMRLRQCRSGNDQAYMWIHKLKSNQSGTLHWNFEEIQVKKLGQGSKNPAPGSIKQMQGWKKQGPGSKTWLHDAPMCPLSGHTRCWPGVTSFLRGQFINKGTPLHEARHTPNSLRYSVAGGRSLLLRNVARTLRSLRSLPGQWRQAHGMVEDIWAQRKGFHN